MSVSISEQETVVNFSRDGELATVYTSDSTVMTKLDKLAADEHAPYWKLKEVHRLTDGTIAGKTYETHKRLISFRSNMVSRELTDEQKEAAAERMKNLRATKHAEINSTPTT